MCDNRLAKREPRPCINRILILILLLFESVSIPAQVRQIATTGAVQVVGSTKSTPALTVVGQNAIGLSTAGKLNVYAGIDYIRMFSRASTSIHVILPDTTVNVGEYIAVPVIIQKGKERSGHVTVTRISVEFRYDCQVVDLFGVSETAVSDGYCTALLTVYPSENEEDTIWINGISKLCSVTSTRLTARRATAEAERGRVAVVVSNGEIRQTGHCVTDGETRLVFAPVGITVAPYPASGSAHVNLVAFNQHYGTLRLMDLQGSTVRVVDVQSAQDGSFSTQIDLAGLASGAYMLHYVHQTGLSSAVLQVTQ